MTAASTPPASGTGHAHDHDADERLDVDVDVVIVGAGPVGLVLGIQFAQRGRSVAILEQWPEPYPLPRAVHFDHEIGRVLQSCGIGDEVRAIAEPAEVYEWRSAAGQTLLRFGRIGLAMSGWPFSSMFSQPDLEALLTTRAEQLSSLTIHRATRVHDLAQHADHVAVTVGDVAAGADRTLTELPDTNRTVRARYVVGCDGANSTTRERAGLGMNDRGFFYDWLIVDVVLDEPRVFDPVNLQVCDPARPTTAVSGGPGRRRWEFMRLPDESIADLGDEQRAWELLAPWDVTPDNARLERHAVYTFQARVADRWHDRRVLLAGDAAHLMPPFAGQGMCSGLRDAANLAWKLDLVLTGHATSAVLATYDQERRPSAESAVDFSVELGKVICVADPAAAAERDAGFAAVYDGGVSEAPGLPGIAAGIVQPDTPRAGELFPQGQSDAQRFDDVHGAGFRLVTTQRPDDLDPGVTEWFAGIGGAVVTVGDEWSNLTGWFETHEVAWALQRPDFHLFGTAVDATGAAALLTELRNHLTATTILTATT